MVVSCCMVKLLKRLNPYTVKAIIKYAGLTDE